MKKLEKLVKYLYCRIKELGTAAFSNDYNDLDNTPIIPSQNNYTIDIVANELKLYENGTEVGSEDLTIYLDDTNLSRLVSGVLDVNTGIATFTRDDSSTIQLDLSNFTNSINNKVDKEFLGWVQVADTQYDNSNRLTIPANTRTKLTNNAGSVLDLVGLFGATTIWNSSTNKIENDLSGDKFSHRVSFIADPTLNNRNLTLELDIGGTQGVIWSRTIRLARGAGVDTKVTENIEYYTLGTFIANGGEFYITCDGDLDVYDILFLIHRTFRNN